MSSAQIISDDVPLIDFSPAFDETASASKSPTYRAMADCLVDKLKTYGFAYLKSDAVEQKLIDDLMSAAERFFQLPYDVKIKYQMNAVSFEGKNGYMGLDFERLDQNYEGATEWRESYNLYDLEIPLAPDYDCPGLQAAYHTFFRRSKEVLLVILRALAVGLNLEDENIFDTMFQDMGTSGSLGMLRILHYPPLITEAGKEVQRCGPHADYSFVTLNFQDNAGGLQMFNRKTGEYVPAPNIPGTIVIQNGLAMEKMTDGMFTGTFHRVFEVGASENYRRQSIAFFGQPDHNVHLKNLFRYHVVEEGDEDIVTSQVFARDLYEASFKKGYR